MPLPDDTPVPPADTGNSPSAYSPTSGAPESAPRASRSARRVEAAANSLRTLIRDLYLDLFPAAKVPEQLRFEIRCVASPGEQWGLTFDPPLESQLVSAFEEQEAGQGAVTAGRVFSYKDQQTIPPPTVRHVFKGYDNFGAPEWCEFPQLLIDSRHPEVDQIYRPKAPKLLSQLTLGKELKANQLSSFGKSSKTYSILGQVAVGFLSVPAGGHWSHPERERLALTFQVVEARDNRGALQVKINTLCGPADPADVEELLADRRHAWIRRARDIAASRLEEITREAMTARARRDGEAVLRAMQKTGRVLRDMARHLERGDRQSQGRTRHAENRRQTDRRPVPKAREDAERAQAETTFLDESRGTFVIWGRHQRAHVFNAEGRHITSFFLEPDQVEFRLRTRRWRLVSPDEFSSLLGAITTARSAAPDPDRPEERPNNPLK